MSERKRSGLGAIFLTLFIDLAGFSIIFPLYPALLEYYLGTSGAADTLLRDLVSWLHEATGVTPVGSRPHPNVLALVGGLLGSLYSILQFLAAPFWGALSDRVGRRRVLLISVTGLAASYALWFFSGSFTLLVASRLFGGIMAGNIATATAAVADVTTPESRAKGMGVVGMAFGLGFILGPAIGAGLSLLNLLDVSPGLAAWGVNPFSAAAGGAFVLCVVNLIFLRTRFQETLRAEDREKARGARRSVNPLARLRPVDIRGVNRTCAVNLVFMFAFSGMEFTLTFLTRERFAYSPRDIAVMFCLVGVILAVVQGGVVRRLAPRFGEKRLGVFGLLLVIPGLAALAYASSEVVLYSGLAAMAAGSALVIPCFRALASLYSPAERQGEVLGLFSSMGALARAFGPATAGAIYYAFNSSVAYLAGAAVLLVPVLLAAALKQPEK